MYARDIFNDLVRRLESSGGASLTHEESINLCARALETEQALSEILADCGTTYETRSMQGEIQIKARPEYAQRSEAAKQAARLLQELGLTPVARHRAKAGPKSGSGAGGEFDGF